MACCGGCFSGLCQWLCKKQRPPPAQEANVTEANVTAGELSSILGNALPDPIIDDIARSLEAEEEAGENSHVPAGGAELLEAAEGADSALALQRVQSASCAAVNATDELGRNALLLAAAEGHLEACQALLQREDFQGVNARTSIGATALHLAAANDEPEICRAILSCARFSAGVNASTNAGQTPLDFSMEFGTGDASEVLQEAGGQHLRRSSRRDVASRLRRPGHGQPLPAD
mmetsp:Transcript_142502/g.262789  ORF Transcript_142502/g.262789 Transcript_142502/m.262789 type:complete len:232 (-) Transcript_142502:6-701(-)